MFITSDGKEFENFLDAYNYVEPTVNRYNSPVITTTEKLKWLHESCGSKIIIIEIGEFIKELDGKNLVTWTLKSEFPRREAILGIFDLRDKLNANKFFFSLDLFSLIKLTEEEREINLYSMLTKEQEKELDNFHTEIYGKLKISDIC